jgi:nickel-dependent lactate racemase
MDGKSLALPFGRLALQVTVPQASLIDVLAPGIPGPSEELLDEAALVRKALAQPIGSPRLRELARPGERITIVISDLTRPCPSARLLPPILDELAAAGVAEGDITVVVALGLHRPMTASELEAAAGPKLFGRVRAINHDPADVVHLGVTTAGTPVEIFRPVVEADKRVCLANLELHYFAGYSGGAKSILPGCASRATVTANHAMMVRPEARAGRLAGNPVRDDLEEGAALVGIDFILNVVVDGEHRIVGAVAGNATAAHRQGCELVAQRGLVGIPERADVVLVSAGGHPKDVNLYQAQKALDNAAHAVRDGGTIILAAECGEGLGNKTFEAWIRAAASPEDWLDRIQREFVLGGHKAAAIAMVLQRAEVYLVSTLPADLVQRCGMQPFDDLDAALAAALERLGARARILGMPQGGSILPLPDG